MSASASISTLSEFLLQAHTQFEVFDLGRGLRKLSQQTFFEWENQQAPCAFPRQDHAWFCIVFWNEKRSSQRYIWFIKLPLDENGLMISASLQQFLDIIAQALGKQLEHTGNSQAQLPENPYVFTPSQQQLANCNAHIQKTLKLERAHSTRATAYLSAPNALHDAQSWRALSLQDIADYVINPCLPANSEESVQTLIAQNLEAYAPEVQNCLFASLESVAVGCTLTKALIHFHRGCDDPHLAALCLRAMSLLPHKLCSKYILSLIGTHSDTENAFVKDTHANLPVSVLNMETSVVIAGRYWSLINNDLTLEAFMHKVAIGDPSFQLFKGLYADLVKIPETRNTMLRFIRHPRRSEQVGKAIGALFAST